MRSARLKTPIRSAYGFSIQLNKPWNHPWSSIGTPVTTLPTATPKEEREEQARDREHHVPRALPHRVHDVMPELERDAPAHQQPEHNDQRQVEPAEPHGKRPRKREERGDTD